MKALEKVSDFVGKYMAAIVIVVAALAYTCVKMLPYGPICALFGLVAGIMKYRKVTQFNSLTVQRFKNTYKDCYDAKKLNAYVDKMF